MLKIYSQAGEEGYIQSLLNYIGTTNKFLVDLGAGNGYYLSNTQYFLEQGFTGIRMDGNNHGNPDVKQEWITKDNICDLLKKYDCPKEFDLLSIDLDGNDYFILDALLKEYRPRLIVAEFNGTIPVNVSKTIEYNENHTWKNDDFYGYSFEAGKKLAAKHGYTVVFQNDALNLYMIPKYIANTWFEKKEVTYTPNQYHAHNSTGKWITV